jgi:hypothetical protein
MASARSRFSKVPPSAKVSSLIFTGEKKPGIDADDLTA